ncbi:MAG: DNA helicase RecG, partial [Acidimicrobiales bacterium]|nr:DNA helicase RecG [Acidimicrobiales bacterium]
MARRLAQLAQVPVDDLRGVGPKTATALAAVGVASVLDLLLYYPRRYLDRTATATIRDLAEGEQATVLVEVKRVTARRTRNRRSLVQVSVGDGTASMGITFFNQPWRER